MPRCRFTGRRSSNYRPSGCRIDMPVERTTASGGLQVIEVMYRKADFGGDVCMDHSLAASNV